MRTFLICALVLAPRAALASVFIDAEEIPWPDTIVASARQGLDADVAAGDYDDLGIRIPVTGATSRLPPEAVSIEDGQPLLEVSARSFAGWPDDVRRAVLDRVVARSFDPDRVPIYRASVEVPPNAFALSATRFVHLLGTLKVDMPEEVDASELLAPFARAWAYHDSGRDGPNCWDSAIASTSARWSRPRYMSPGEFVCQLAHYYAPVPSGNGLEGLELGDVVRLVDPAGEEIHGFVYLGPDRRDPHRHIVFTKNGFRRSYYLFQDYETVTGTLYPGMTASYYRALRPAPDPDEEESPCRHRAPSPPETRRADPVLAAGLRAMDAPVEIE